MGFGQLWQFRGGYEGFKIVLGELKGGRDVRQRYCVRCLRHNCKLVYEFKFGIFIWPIWPSSLHRTGAIIDLCSGLRIGKHNILTDKLDAQLGENIMYFKCLTARH